MKTRYLGLLTLLFATYLASPCTAEILTRELVPAPPVGEFFNAESYVEISGNGNVVQFITFVDDNGQTNTPLFGYNFSTEEMVQVSPDEWLDPLSFDIKFAALSPDGGTTTALRNNNDLFIGPVGGTLTQVTLPIALGSVGAPRVLDGGEVAVFWCQGCGNFSGQMDGFIDDDNGLHHIALLKDGELSAIDRAQDGTLADGMSLYPRISSDGRYVAFESEADNLTTVAEHVNSDIFVKDLQTGAVELINKTTGGTPGDGDATLQGVTSDLSYIAFSSSGGSVVLGGQSNSFSGLYIRNRTAGETIQLQIPDGYTSGGGAICFSISDDGRYYLLAASDIYLDTDSDPNYGQKWFRYDRTEVTLELITEAVGSTALMSADGSKVVVFTTDSYDASDTDEDEDVYLFTFGEGGPTPTPSATPSPDPVPDTPEEVSDALEDLLAKALSLPKDKTERAEAIAEIDAAIAALENALTGDFLSDDQKLKVQSAIKALNKLKKAKKKSRKKAAKKKAKKAVSAALAALGG